MKLRRSSALLVVAGAILLAAAGILAWKGNPSVAQAQDDLTAEFEERLAQIASGVPVSDLGDPTPGEAAPDPEPVSTSDVGDDPRLVTPYASGARYEPAEVPEANRIPGILRELAPAEGEVAGRIRIPALDLDWMVIEGVGLEQLALGPGHMPWTPLPGQPGNAVISGHRTTHGAPFFDLDLLNDGDLIYVDTLTGTHTYRFDSSVTVLPTGVWVTDQWEGAWLTLTTCTPKHSAAARLAVFAELVDGPNYEAIDANTESASPTPPDNA